ncbi:MAG: S8 family serine peptidase [Crocinitomicaceae bacterium]|nr:S8 family serine peptidase [Crocinitomicaceae bacterium]
MYTFKSLTLTVAFLAATFISFSQEPSKIWLTISNPSDVPFENEAGVLVSNDASLQDAISSLNITEVEKAIPSSRQAALLSVYELTSYTSDVVDMYAELTNSLDASSKVVYAPVYETLNAPNDYLKVFPEDYALDLINAQEAWDVTTGNSDIVLAISDQNYFTDHDEIAGKYVYYDATNTSSQTHGTAVAITAAGSTGNNIGKSAIGYNSSLALYKMNYNEVLDASYAGYRVINLSWSSGCSYNQYVQDIINEVYDNGTFIVAAAGNGSTCGGPSNLVYPASFDNVFAVTSTGPNDNHERVIGDASTTHQHNASVDLSAPGYDIAISAAQGWYLYGSGSSYASPLVTGTIGLILDANPCITNAEISWLLKASSTNVDALNPSYAGMIGAGRLNAKAAVDMAIEINKFSLDISSGVTCQSNSGQIEVEIVGGTAPYTTQWSNGATDLILSDLSVGHYDLTVVDASGCQLDTSIVIEEVIPTQFEGTVQNVTCNGAANGAIDVTVLDGTPGFTFEWDNGMMTEDISGLVAGTYRLKITNANGCSVWGSYTVEQSASLVAELEVIQPTADEDGEIDLTVSGGVAPYTYTWANGETSEDLFNVTAGFYEVTVMDANGCDVITNTIVEEMSVAGIEDMDGIQTSVYPNPTTDVATVTWNSAAVTNITIVNANGQVVQNAAVAMQNTYKVEDLNPGMYFINLTDAYKHLNTQKLIVR